MTGYKNPPLHSRFQTGQSGNPKGRPKKQAARPTTKCSASELILREAERMIKIREGADIKEATAIEAVNRAQIQSALKGSAYAQRDVIARYDAAERERREQIKSDCEHWESYITKWKQKIADAEKEGKKAPNPIPHPDDITVDYERGVFCRGPQTEAEAAEIDSLVVYRDLLIKQWSHDRRIARKKTGKEPGEEPSAASLFVLYVNDRLPKRLRLTDLDIISSRMAADAKSMRVLEKELAQAKRSIGSPHSRGDMFLSLKVGIAVIRSVQASQPG